MYILMQWCQFYDDINLNFDRWGKTNTVIKILKEGNTLISKKLFSDRKIQNFDKIFCEMLDCTFFLIAMNVVHKS